MDVPNAVPEPIVNGAPGRPPGAKSRSPLRFRLGEYVLGPIVECDATAITLGTLAGNDTSFVFKPAAANV
jgi:hypothetical protein